MDKETLNEFAIWTAIVFLGSLTGSIIANHFLK